MIKIGVVGYGYWGPNLARNFAECDKTSVSAISDLRPQRLKIAQTKHPGVATYESPDDLIADPNVDAVAIATPVSTHFELALAALRAGKHVLVEKPLASTSEQTLRLIEEAERRNLTLMVDHTFVYTGAVRKIKNLVDSGQLGQLYYYDAVRVNLGLFQRDVNVLWDLAVHDLSILTYVINAEPYAITATGMSHVSGQPEDVGYLTLFFPNNLIAHVHVNWLAPMKIRRTLIGGSLKMIVYDDVEPSEKVKVYDRGIAVNGSPDSIYKLLISYRSGDILVPHLDITEALRAEVEHFANCICTGQESLTSGDVGLKVVRILEAASASIKAGHVIELDYAAKRQSA